MESHTSVIPHFLTRTLVRTDTVRGRHTVFGDLIVTTSTKGRKQERRTGTSQGSGVGSSKNDLLASTSSATSPVLFPTVQNLLVRSDLSLNPGPVKRVGSG